MSGQSKRSSDPIRVILREAAEQEKAAAKKQAVTEAQEQAKSTQVSDLNLLEEYLNPANYKPSGPSDQDAIAAALLNLESQKLELARIFMSNDLQKTEITASERKLLPLMHILAHNPFDLPGKPGEFDHPELKLFIAQYMELGIPLNRQGRKEEVEIMNSLLSKGTEVQTSEEGGIKGFLKKAGK